MDMDFDIYYEEKIIYRQIIDNIIIEVKINAYKNINHGYTNEEFDKSFVKDFDKYCKGGMDWVMDTAKERLKETFDKINASRREARIKIERKRKQELLDKDKKRENIEKDKKEFVKQIPKHNKIREKKISPYSKYQNLKAYPAKNNKTNIEYNSYKNSSFYSLKKDYTTETILYKSLNKYSKIKKEHIQLEREKQAIIRKGDLSLFEIVIQFDKEHFNRIIEANALDKNKRNHSYIKSHMSMLIDMYIKEVENKFGLKALEYTIKENINCFDLNILFYNYNFTEKKTIVKYLKATDCNKFDKLLNIFFKIGFEYRSSGTTIKLSKNQKRVLKSVNKMLEQDKENKKRLPY